MAEESRLSRLENRVDRIESDVSAIKTEQAETRVYVKQILERIEDLRAIISSAKNGSESTKTWIDLVKWLVGGTIFVLIAYIFGSGGGGLS